MKKQPGLEIAEYVSLAGSVLGTIVAVTSGKLVFAAAPLTVALSLNLLNRRRFQQETINYTSGILTEAQEAFRSLNEQVQALPALNLKVDTINQKFDTRPEMQLLRQSESSIAQLSSRLDAMSPLNHQSTVLEADLHSVKEAIADIYNQINSLSSSTQVLTTPDLDLSSVEEGFADIYNHLNAITSQLDKPTPAVDLTSIEEAIASLNTQLNTVNSRLDESPTPATVDLSEVEEAINDLKAQLNTVTLRLDELPPPTEANFSEAEYAILDINTQLDALNQQFTNRSEAQAIEQLQREIPQLSEQLNSLTLRLDNAPTPQAVDLSGVETAIAQINQRFEALNQQFNTRPETQAIEQLQGAIPELSQQLNSLTLRLDTPTTAKVDLSGIETAITDINNRLDSVTQRFETPIQAVDLSGVETAIADMNSRLNVLNQQFNTQLETQKIEQLKSSIPQLKEQVNVMNLRLDTLVKSADIDFSQEQEILADINFQLDTINQRLDHPPGSFKVDHNEIEETLSGINFQLRALALDLETIPDPMLAVDLTGGEESIDVINSQINNLNQQFNTQTETLNREQIEKTISQQLEQTKAMELRVEGLTNLSEAELKKEKKTIANINLGLEALVLFIEDIPADAEIDLTEVVIALGDINGEIDAYAQHLDTLPTA
ncbi:MAG: hypothetical protein WA828_06010 [Coleofasciculaceae cyanobacterium]